MSALGPLDEALTALLRADATLTALLPGGVHNGSAPRTSIRPYLVFGSPTEAESNVFARYGQAVEITFDTFSAPNVKSAAVVNTVLDRVEALLRSALTLAGHTSARLRKDFRTVLVEDDETRHGVARFTLLTFESA